jgi:hypothetical protein
VVGHQAICPHLCPRLSGGFLDQAEIKPKIVVAKEHRLAPVSALGDVVGNAWNDDASEAGDREFLRFRDR